MKENNRYLDKDMKGSIELFPEDREDLWHLFNIIAKGNSITQLTKRKVKIETASSAVQEIKTLKLTIKVEKIEYDSESSEIRVSGIVQNQNRFVKVGRYHSITIGIKKHPIKIWKFHWDQMYLDRIKNQLDDKRKADVAAVLINKGEAHIYLIGEAMTIHIASFNTTIPKKTNVKIHNSKMKAFFKKVATSLVNNIDFKIVKAIVLGSPGFVNTQLIDAMMDLSHTKPQIYSILEKKRHVFVCAHVSSAHPACLNELMTSPDVESKLGDTKAFEQTKALELFYTTMKDREELAIYGPKECKIAIGLGSVEHLLISDDLFRSNNYQERKRWIKETKIAEQFGGHVYVFSSAHQSGKSLNDHGGVAAILRYHLDDAVLNPSAYKKNTKKKKKEDIDYVSDDPSSGFSSDEDDNLYYYESPNIGTYVNAEGKTLHNMYLLKDGSRPNMKYTRSRLKCPELLK
mmetsp:Transcript_9531/g.14084  ORF Transcript_9531/g.14084 Transcript_9531/m.14084 type:complete len:459 (+) Transcript_9531:61-1437(+)